MTTYTLTDIFNYTGDQLLEILGKEYDTKYARKLLITKLLEDDKLDEDSVNIVTNRRFWEIYDMSEEHLNALSWEDTKLNMMLDVLSTPTSAKILDSCFDVGILNTDIMSQIILNTKDLSTISKLYQSSTYNKDLLNTASFLRDLASNIKKRLVEYPTDESRLEFEGGVTTDDMYINEIYNYDDFIQWYEIHYYHTREKCNKELIYCFSNALSNGYTEDALVMLEELKSQDEVDVPLTLPPSQILSLLKYQNFKMNATIGLYELFVSIIGNYNRGILLSQVDIDASIELLDRYGQDQLVEVMETSLDYPTLFIAVYNYVRSLGNSDDQIIQMWADFEDLESFGTFIRFEGYLESIINTIGLERLTNVTNSMVEHSLKLEANNATDDDPKEFEKVLYLARREGVSEEVIAKSIESTLKHINEVQNRDENNYSLLRLFSPFIVQLFMDSKTDTEPAPYINEDTRSELYNTIHEQVSDMLKENPSSYTPYGIPDRTFYFNRQLRKIKKAAEAQDIGVLSLLEELKKTTEEKQDIPIIKTYLDSQIRV